MELYKDDFNDEKCKYCDGNVCDTYEYELYGCIGNPSSIYKICDWCGAEYYH